MHVVLLLAGFFLALALALSAKSRKFPASRLTCDNTRDAASTSLREAEDLRVLPGASSITIPKCPKLKHCSCGFCWVQLYRSRALSIPSLKKSITTPAFPLLWVQWNRQPLDLTLVHHIIMIHDYRVIMVSMCSVFSFNVSMSRYPISDNR